MAKIDIERLKRQKMRPATLGDILREEASREEASREEASRGCDLTQTDFARLLGVSRKTVSEVLLNKRPLTPIMAHRIGRLLGTSADFWIALQTNIDLWDALHYNASALEDIELLKTSA